MDPHIVQGHVEGGKAGNPFQDCLSLKIIFCVVVFFFFLLLLFQAQRLVCAESEIAIVGKREWKMETEEALTEDWGPKPHFVKTASCLSKTRSNRQVDLPSVGMCPKRVIISWY